MGGIGLVKVDLRLPLCAFAAFLDNSGWDQPEGEEDESWNDQQIVKMTDDWNKIRNEIDRRQGIRHCCAQ